MSSTLSITCVFVCSLLLSVCCSVLVHGQRQSYNTTLDITSLQGTGQCSNSTGSRPPNALQMVHSYGACAPPGGNRTLPSLKDVLLSDRIRLAYIGRKLGINGDQFPSQLTLPSMSSGHLSIVMGVGLGSQTSKQIVSVDTGSDLCWVTCAPCTVGCEDQAANTLFNPSASISYSKLNCGDSMCSEIDAEDRTCPTVESDCKYDYDYGDKSATQGDLSRETLTLTSTEKIPNFVFGCSHSLTGNWDAGIGLFGMGRGPLSLISQVAPRYGNVFSFCVPQTSSSVGYLELGPSTRTDISYTPMVTNCSGANTFYYAKLTGISVSGVLLNIQPETISPCSTIIDSGTAVTRLHPTIYTLLAQAFMRGMSNYKLIPPATENDVICYDSTGLTSMTIPGIFLHFDGGIVLKLNGQQVMFVYPNKACLGFLPVPADLGMNTIGYTQQRMYEVVYDSGNSRIGFGPGSC